jgi:hypothetical protein
MFTENITTNKTYVAKTYGEKIRFTPIGSGKFNATFVHTPPIGPVQTKIVKQNNNDVAFGPLDIGSVVTATIISGTFTVHTDVDRAMWSDSTGTSLVKPDGTTATPTTITTPLTATNGQQLGNAVDVIANPAGTTALLAAHESSITYTGNGDITGAGHLIGSNSTVTVNSAGKTVGLAIGAEGDVRIQDGTGTLTYGVLGTLLDNVAGSTLTQHMGVKGTLNDNHGTVSNAIGVGAGIEGNSGTITNYIGFQVQDISAIAGITRKYAFSNSNTDAPVYSASGICDASFQVPAAPTNGGSTTINRDTTLVVLIPSGTIASHTINLPTTMAPGQMIQFFCTQIITTLTINGGGNTVYGGPATIAANGFFSLRFLNGLGWVRVG